jgi:glycosyltransferase involved in cell wall biosynthesis
LLIDEETPQALARGIKWLLEDDRWTHFGKNAKEWAKKFSWDEVANRLDKLIQGG